MIKYETIISNFDDKTTLYNWLRKVEEALKHASATNFVVNKKGNATLSFSITFADGTTLESGDIVLQQGESVDDARIASGILQLHLTNGTWLTAGNIKPVNNFSIDASQHLIVNYQDGTSQDLGPIFSGNVVISGNLQVTGKITGVTALESIKDASDHNRFIEGNITLTGAMPSGMHLDFGKWSLSGTHLMFVIAGHVDDETTIPAGYIAQPTIPQWLLDKIFPMSSGTAVDYKAVPLFDNQLNTQSINVIFYKITLNLLP